MKLADYTQGRDNNFNLVRILAAFAVLISHSFGAAVRDNHDPVQKILGMSTGRMAVDVFFITSGFLVTASLINRRSLLEFIWARTLRIFPALWGMSLLAVFGLGLFFTTLPKREYLACPQTYAYLLECGTLIKTVAYHLPGVFETNPFPNTVNESLWTMTTEVRMYSLLAFAWLVLKMVRKQRLENFKIIIVLSAVIGWASEMYCLLHPSVPRSHLAKLLGQPLFFMFFTGAAFYVLKERIVLSRWVFWGFVGALLASTVNKQVFLAVYDLTLAYILFYLAYVPSGVIRNYNRLGDYSYGIYIYGSPVQQSIAALIPGVSVGHMMLLASSITLPLAMLSWHLFEKRALSLRSRAVEFTRSVLTSLGFSPEARNSQPNAL